MKVTPGQYLIIWDHTPRDASLEPVNTSDHVTPLHWAVCVATESEEKVAGVGASESELADQPEQGGLKITILDLNRRSHENNHLYQQYLSADKTSLEWLRIVQPADLIGSVDVNGDFQLDQTAISPAVCESRLFPHGRKVKRPILSSFFTEKIRDELTSPSKPDDRHAITNIIGSLVLLTDKDVRNDFEEGSAYIQEGKRVEPPENIRMSDHREALKAVFRTAKLLDSPPLLGSLKREFLRNSNVSPPPSSSGKEAIEAARKAIAELIETIPKGPKLRVTFIDDQWHHGWYEWLKAVLPAGILFTVCPDPELLFNKLKAAQTADTDLRFKLDLTPPFPEQSQGVALVEDSASQEFADIVLLDLRLFSGNSTREKTFYQNLLPLCRKFEERDDPPRAMSGSSEAKSVINRAWRGFTTVELEAIERWIKGERDDSAHHICLSLFPRLLALMDMSLPIVLWSSTGQAQLLKQFSGYGNVVIAFEKPRFFGTSPVEVRQSSLLRVTEALSQAVDLLNAGAKCRLLDRLNLQSSDQQKAHEGQTKWHLELYIDETGNRADANFSVGGCFAIFSDAKAPLKRADEFDAILVANGIRYFDSLGLDANGVSIKAKNDGCSVELDAACEAAEIAGIPAKLGYVRLTPALTSFGELHGELQTFERGDNRYQQTLKALIELFVYETLPAITGCPPSNQNVTLSIYAATRIAAFESADRAVADELAYRYGFHAFPIKTQTFLQSLSRDGIYGLIAEVEMLHQTSAHHERLIAVPLVYETPEHNKLVKHAEYYRLNMQPQSTSIPCVRLKIGDGEFDDKLRGQKDDGRAALMEKIGWDVEEAVLQKHPSLGIFGRIKTNPQGNSFCFIRTKDGNELYSNISNWPSPRPCEGDFVTDIVTADYGNGPVCISFSMFPRDEAEKAWEDGLRVSGWLPDYRACHYVADQILPGTSVQNYKGFTVDLPGQFDEVYSGELWQSLLASRRLDCGDVGDAVVAVNVDAGFEQQAPDRVRSSARLMVARRVASKLPRMEGDEFAVVVEHFRAQRRASAQVSAPAIDHAGHDMNWIVIENIPKAKHWRSEICKLFERTTGFSVQQVDLSQNVGGMRCAFVLLQDIAEVDDALQELHAAPDWRRNASRSRSTI